MQNRNTGFTLIELMIVVALIGVLAGIAIPSYQSQVRKSNRSDAKVALTTIAQRIQRCYTGIGTYSPKKEGQCLVIDTIKSAGIISDEGFYKVSIDEKELSANAFTLRAKPVAGGRQADDKDCAEFSIDQIGNKKASSTAGVDMSKTCW